MNPRAVAICVALALGVATCGKPGPAPVLEQGPPPDALVKTTENGAVKVEVKVWPVAPKLDGFIYVNVVASAVPGVQVTLPFEDAALGRFGVFAYQQASPQTRDGRLITEVRYQLTPPASGRHRLPPFRVEVLDTRTAGAASEFLTEEVPLEVSPIDTQALAQALRPPRGELDAFVGLKPWWWWAGFVPLLLAWLALGRALWLRLRAPAAGVTAKTAYEEAVARLAQLGARGAPDGDGLDAWFVELSSVVRRYIEGRYAIAAPELTTEEFLVAATQSAELSDAERKTLRAFLERCDAVKFAGYRPSPAESLATLEVATQFVEHTRQAESLALATEPRAPSAKEESHVASA